MKLLQLLFALALLCNLAAAQVPSAPINLAVSVNGITRGCGAGTSGSVIYDQSTCGNYPGAPYEDLVTASPTTPPIPVSPGTVHTINSCTNIVPVAGDVWRFGSDINDGVGGTNQFCIHFQGQGTSKWILDLAGHTLIGGIAADQNLGGNGIGGQTIVNGTISCNIANGGTEACIRELNGGNLSSSFMLSHLSIFNINSITHPDNGYKGFEFAVLISVGGTTSNVCTPGFGQKLFNGNCIEVAHVTSANAYGYDGTNYVKDWCARCTTIMVSGAGAITAEEWNTITQNGPWTDADQGTVFFNMGISTAHNNYCQWVRYQGTSDPGRCFLFDAAGKKFNQNGGQIFNNQIEVYNNRGVRTRQVNNVQIHDNRLEHIQSSITTPAIMMGGNGDYAEKIDKSTVKNNTFTHAGGVSIQASESYGLVADGNRWVCESNCSSGELATAWIAEGSNGLTFKINSAVRDSTCLVTLTLAATPASTSMLNGQVYVNVEGRSDDFNVSGTEGNLLITISGATVKYTQANCSGSTTGATGGIFWMAQNSTDNFAANGSQITVKNSTLDPQLNLLQPFVACGTSNPACQNPPQTNHNGGQTQITGCNNPKQVTGGVGTKVQNTCP